MKCETVEERENAGSTTNNINTTLKELSHGKVDDIYHCLNVGGNLISHIWRD